MATDAWHPQVNGVVRVNVQMVEALQARGHEVLVISPDGFRTYPLPSYPEIRLAWRPGKRVQQLQRELAPEAVHIATKGPIGLATPDFYLCRSGRSSDVFVFPSRTDTFGSLPSGRAS